MKKSQLKFLSLAFLGLCIAIAANISISLASVKGKKVTIVNKTNQAIVGIYISESDNLLPNNKKVLYPQENIMIEIGHGGKETKPVLVKLVFANGQEQSVIYKK